MPKIPRCCFLFFDKLKKLGIDCKFIPFVFWGLVIVMILAVAYFFIGRQKRLPFLEQFLVQPVSTTTKILTPAADTYVSSSSDSKNSNFGSQAVLQTDKKPQKNIYLKFDLSSLAPLSSSQVVSAKLKLRVLEGSYFTQNISLTSTSTWEEKALTYSNQPGHGSVLSTFKPTRASAFVEVDVKSALTKALSTNPSSKQLSLVIFTGAGTSSDKARFSSREATNSTYRPSLTITYLSPATPTPPTTPISAQAGAPYYGGAEGPLPAGANPGIDTVVEYAAFRGKAVLFAGDLNNQTNQPQRAANGRWERHTTSHIPVYTSITMFNAYGAYSGSRVYVIGTWFNGNPTVQKWFTSWYSYDPDSTTMDGWLNISGASGHSDRAGIVFDYPAFYHVNNQVLASLRLPPNTECSVVVRTYSNSNPVEIDYKWSPTNNTYLLLLSQSSSSKVYTDSAALNCTSFSWPNTANYTTANRRQTAEVYINQAGAPGVVYINSSNQLVNWPYSVSVPANVYALDVTSNGSILVLQDTTGAMWVCPVSGSCTPFIDNGQQLTIATGISFQTTKLEASAVQLIWGGATPCSAVYPEASQAVNSCSPAPSLGQCACQQGVVTSNSCVSPNVPFCKNSTTWCVCGTLCQAPNFCASDALQPNCGGVTNDLCSGHDVCCVPISAKYEQFLCQYPNQCVPTNSCLPDNIRNGLCDVEIINAVCCNQ